ncbi:MAG: signal recognition particle-docking protein FtsY [Dehalococcoidia bacterium]|nr:signal recognition particle-docking protein FtsY [Dehalococcoidia bacterium]
MANTSRNWAERVSSLFRRGSLDESLWDELEEALIVADVGASTTFSLLERLRDRVRSEQIIDPAVALETLRAEVRALLRSVGEPGDPDRLLDPGDADGPLVLLVVGVNGVGKTTTIAKLAHLYRSDRSDVILGAADTFRAAAIEQLQVWGHRLGVRVVAHSVGADPGAVAFDTVKAARASSADVAIIDTAGRMHTKTNLMEEMRKVRRVVERSEAGRVRVLMVMDAATGQNGLQQARNFVEAVGCDGVVLAKLDGTAKGGVVLAIVSELGLPVLFVGTGEQLDDLAPFDAGAFAEALFSGPRN